MATARDAVARYERAIDDDPAVPSSTDIRAELAGSDLACWCALDQPCHADVLMSIANDTGKQLG
jgi:hypothetical protein